MDHLLFFREELLRWGEANRRNLPWVGERDPYKVWLSEILLQQTRVAQGLGYYARFVAQFPTVADLAAASEDDVFKLWEGLGYYTRARNLHAAARHIAYVLNGQFPDTYEGIRALKGVGDYTAAAIASFAFQLPHAALDGNMYRVLARFFGITTPVGSPAGKRTFSILAAKALDPDRPGAFNQSMMDFGATLCMPAKPLCGHCPLSAHCKALASQTVGDLPVKQAKAARKSRFFLYVVLRMGSKTFVRKRREKDIWQHLYEFPMIELEALPDDSMKAMDIIRTNFFPEAGRLNPTFHSMTGSFRQILTHQTVTAVFCSLEIPEKMLPEVISESPFRSWEMIEIDDVKKKLAVPRIIFLYFQKMPALLGLF